MDRKEFLKSAGLAGLGTGLCCALGRNAAAQAQEQAVTAPTHSCQEKVHFAQSWVTRFMDVLDGDLDPATRARIMEANGKACFRAYMKSVDRQITPVPFESWAEKVRQHPEADLRVDGRTIHLAYLTNYQGKPVPEGACLCPLVESKPAGLSATYCHCSVGYIAEWLGQTFGRPVTVELQESVLRGGKRCRFKIDVA